MSVESYKDRQERIQARMRAMREAEKTDYIDQSKPGWSKGMTWQELLDARQSPRINVSKP